VNYVELASDGFGLLQNKGIQSELITPQRGGHASRTCSNDDYVMHVLVGSDYA
jgi:hypothetical protein